MKRIYLMITVLLTGCIGTDILEDMMEERVIIESMITSLKVGDSYQFSAKYFNNVGQEETNVFVWQSSDPSIISIDNNGLATAQSLGTAILTASVGNVADSITIIADNETVIAPMERVATLNTVSSYPLSGTATLSQGNNGLILEFSDDFSTTSALPGLYVYLTNNINTINGALEIGPVTNFSGSQSYQITETDDLFKYGYVLFYCKPFVVPVGNGKLEP